MNARARGRPASAPGLPTRSGRPPPLITCDVGASTGPEERGRELRRWAARVLGLLAAITAVIAGLDAFVLYAAPTFASPHEAAFRPLSWLVPASLGVAALVVVRWPRSAAGIEAWTCGALVIAVAVSAARDALFQPGVPPSRTNAILLFVAAVLPWRLRYQAILAVTAALSWPVLATLAADQVPAVGAAWAATPDPILDRVIRSTFATAVLAGASVGVTWAMRNLRTQLRKAQRQGNYVIERELGKGGMGDVYVARHALIRRPTAVKVMRPDPSRGAEMAGRFEREVQLSASLTHPNTITVYDFGRTTDGETFYYAMEYLDGLDLQRLVDRHGPLPPERACFLLRQACGSLGEAHRMGILHRDVKPSNLFLTVRGGLHDFVKVLDFGLAKDMGPADPEITRAGQLFGTPHYISPELARGDESVEGSADIYSLGCVAFFALTGRTPFQGATPYGVVWKHLNEPPPRIVDVAPGEIPVPLAAVVERCLAKRPGNRFPTMEDLDAALAAVRFDRPWSYERAREWWAAHPPSTGGAA